MSKTYLLPAVYNGCIEQVRIEMTSVYEGS